MGTSLLVGSPDPAPSPAACSTSRSRRPASAAAARAPRSARPCGACARRPRRDPGRASRSGCRPTSRSPSSSWSGAPRTAGSSATPSTPSSTAGEQRLAGRWAPRPRRAGGEAAIGGDLLVHVPVHAARRAARGYDQAELLARAAAATLGCPALPGAAARAGDGAPVRAGPGSSGGQRRGGVRGRSRPAGRRGRPLGRAGRRRRDDGRHAGRLRRGAPGAGAAAVSALTSAARRDRPRSSVDGLVGRDGPRDGAPRRSKPRGCRPILDGSGCRRTPRPADRPARTHPGGQP